MLKSPISNRTVSSNAGLFVVSALAGIQLERFLLKAVQRTSFHSLTLRAFIALIVCLPMAIPNIATGQLFRQRIGFPDQAVNEDTNKIIGAVLKTDPDLEALLDKANRHAEESNYRVATRLWQAVLERSGDSLYTEDDTNYYSISDQIERILAQLPADALAIYRVTADASARQILTEAKNPNDIAALMRVAGNFFISSEGDDAAYRLGCLYLDQHDFSGALRIFKKIATQHPDPTVSLDEVYARIAICEAFMGNNDQAQKTLATGRGFGADSAAIDAVERSLESLVPPTDLREQVLGRWETIHGNSRRLAAMPALPESTFDQDQYAAWQFFVEPRDERYVRKADTVGKVLLGAECLEDYASKTRNPVEKRMMTEWVKNDWRPAGHLLFDQDHMYFKGPADLVAFDRKKISVGIAQTDLAEKNGKNEIADFASWRSIWRNVFEVNPATAKKEQRASAQMRIRMRRGDNLALKLASVLNIVPRSMHFGDRIHQQMSMHNGIVYTIEGKSFNDRNSHSTTRSHGSHWNLHYRRVRSNFLTAYEAKTGRMLWRLPRVNEPEAPGYDPKKKGATDSEAPELWLSSGGMMGSPIAFANLLIVPVNQNGAVYLYGIDPENEGRTVWSSFLCDEPESGSVISSPINLTIDGSDLFAVSGTGVLFAVDPTTGKIRFAKRYSRAGEEENMQRSRAHITPRINFDGWSSDTIIPNGRELICFCSDADSIFAIDRNDGSLIWKTGLRPYGEKVDYIIGASGDLLFLGGKKTIIAIDLSAEGYVAWGGEPLFEGESSLGRGMVTPQGVFMPVGNAIWRFALDAKKGRGNVLNQVEVFLGTGSPVGNLYSDGQRMWVHGASRLYALAPKRE